MKRPGKITGFQRKKNHSWQVLVLERLWDTSLSLRWRTQQPADPGHNDSHAEKNERLVTCIGCSHYLQTDDTGARASSQKVLVQGKFHVCSLSFHTMNFLSSVTSARHDHPGQKVLKYFSRFLVIATSASSLSAGMLELPLFFPGQILIMYFLHPIVIGEPLWTNLWRFTPGSLVTGLVPSGTQGITGRVHRYALNPIRQTCHRKPVSLIACPCQKVPKSYLYLLLMTSRIISRPSGLCRSAKWCCQ